MARDITTAPVPASTPTLRSSWRFGARIAALVLATLLLVTWTVSQLRTVDDMVNAVPAPVQQSIRQVEHAEQVSGTLRRLEDTEVRRFANQSSAVTPAQPNPHQEQADDAASAQRGRPGVQP